MIHVDHNHPSTSPLKSSASAAALDSFTWDVGDDPFTAGASGMGPDDPLVGGGVGDATDQLVGHAATDFRPEEFLNVNDDLEDVMNLQPDDVDDMGLGGMVDPLGGSSVATSSTSMLQPPPQPQPQQLQVSMTDSSSVRSTVPFGPPLTSSRTDSTFLAASPNMAEGDRSSSLSPVPETNSPSGQGESGSAGDSVEAKEAQASAEAARKEEEEEEEVSAAAKAEISRQSSPLSPLTPAADDDGEGEEGEERKEGGEKKAEEALVNPGKPAKSLPQQQKQHPPAPQHQQLKQPQQGRQITKSPPGPMGNNIPLGAASNFMQQHQQPLRPSPDAAISTPDLIAPSNNNSRDPKVVKVLDLNVELLK
jgi:hypothetical protein